MLFLSFAMNTTRVSFESLFPRQLSATNRAFVIRSILVHYFYIELFISPRYPSSRSREPVGEVKMMLCASLKTTIGKPADSLC